MSAIEFSKAMSSRSRVNILRLLATKDMTADEIAQKLSLKTITVRHHLNVLNLLGMIKEVGEYRRNVGRPAVRYRVTQKPMSVEFPTRHYEVLSNVLLQGLIRTLGRDRTKVTLAEMGREFGGNLARDLAAKHGIKKWNMRALKKYFVELHLDEIGAVPEIVEATDRSLRYKMHNCVLTELAKQHPDVVCEGFDDGLLEGLVRATIQGAEMKQLKCVGHGDPFCEYVLYSKYG